MLSEAGAGSYIGRPSQMSDDDDDHDDKQTHDTSGQSGRQLAM